MIARSNRFVSFFLCLIVFASACSSSPDSIVQSSDAGTLDGIASSNDASVSLDSGGLSVTDADTFDDGPSPGEFGYPCVVNADCNFGYCTETQNGNVCSKGCSTDCPNGFTCAAISNTSSDVVYMCVSSFVRLCDPCREHKDCNSTDKIGNLCIGVGDGGSFCGVQCDTKHGNADCPSNHTCQFVTDAKTKISANQCVPKGGVVCACSKRATQLALSTDCLNKNVFGSCSGQRVCKPEGLSNCIGQIPEAESCNKIDDNCDGQTDNIDPKAVGGQCKQSNEFGTCLGIFTGCDSNGEPICSALAPKPETCNGKDDNCDGQTDEKLCEDGNVCTTGTCNTDGSCKQTKISGTACDDGNVCSTFEQCSSGVCMGGNLLNCDDNDPCSTDWCDPFTGCSHKPASEGKCLEDGNECTQDVCVNGKCTHPSVKDGANCLDEGNVCTNDVCDNGDCAHNANSAKCDDGNQCTLNDSCKDKTCSISLPKVCNDGNACTIDSCDPKKGCVFQSGDGAGPPCPDDGDLCTEDKCKGSTCAHISIPNCN